MIMRQLLPVLLQLHLFIPNLTTAIHFFWILTASKPTDYNLFQLILNSTARAITNTPKYNHITPHLKSLHWLKITQRIQYNILSHIRVTAIQTAFFYSGSS